MKLRLIICLIAMIIATQNYAQRIGLKFALSKPELKLDNINQDNTQLYQGFQIGIYGRTDSRIYMQPEIYYQKKEGNYFNEPGKDGYISTIGTYNQSLTLHTLNVPLVFGLNVIKHKNFTLHGFGGVQSSVVVDSKVSTAYSFAPITKSNIQNITVKYFYGAGFDLFFISFDVRYYNETVDLIDSSNDIIFPSLKHYFTFNLGIKIVK